MLTFTTSFPYIVRGKTRQYSGQLRAYSLEIQSHTPGDILLYNFLALGLSAKYLIFPKAFSLRRDNNLPIADGVTDPNSPPFPLSMNSAT